MQLGLQGTYAGVGDLVEARKLDWSLVGVEGNPRGAINREHYRVQARTGHPATSVTASSDTPCSDDCFIRRRPVTDERPKR